MIKGSKHLPLKTININD